MIEKMEFLCYRTNHVNIIPQKVFFFFFTGPVTQENSNYSSTDNRNHKSRISPLLPKVSDAYTKGSLPQYRNFHLTGKIIC